jgi:hypothetical protein
VPKFPKLSLPFVFFIPVIRAICPTHFIPLKVIALIVFDEEHKYKFLLVNTTINKVNNTGVCLRSFYYHYLFRFLWIIIL